MFNLSGSEIVFLLLIALIVLGPEKLPEAVRKFGKVYAEAKKMTTGFQSELKSALDEPMREMRETAEAFKSAAGLGFNVDEVDAPVDEAAAPTDAVDEPATVDATDVPAAVEATEAPEAPEATDVPEATNEPPPPVAESQPKVGEAVEETGTE